MAYKKVGWHPDPSGVIKIFQEAMELSSGFTNPKKGDAAGMDSQKIFDGPGLPGAPWDLNK